MTYYENHIDTPYDSHYDDPIYAEPYEDEALDYIEYDVDSYYNHLDWENNQPSFADEHDHHIEDYI